MVRFKIFDSNSKLSLSVSLSDPIQSLEMKAVVGKFIVDAIFCFV